MNKKILIIISFLILLIVSISIFFLLPKSKEVSIKSAIEKANYCEVDFDCVDAGGKCPFGCYVYVNKNEVEKITELIQLYTSNCVYDCVSNSLVVCENKKCQEVFK
jgi:hypothetical protein